MSVFPPIAELVPHAGPMRLLAEIVWHDERETRCRVEVGDAELFCDGSGAAPSWLALEWMAQCVAVHAGLLARLAGQGPKPGFLVGTRRLAFSTAHFAPEASLLVAARFAGSAGALVSFQCDVRASTDSAPLAEGTLSLYISEAFA